MLNKLKGALDNNIDTSKMEQAIFKFVQQSAQQYIKDGRAEEDWFKLVAILAKLGIKINLDADMIFEFAKNPNITLEDFTKELGKQYAIKKGPEIAKIVLAKGKDAITAEMLIKGLKLIK